MSVTEGFSVVNINADDKRLVTADEVRAFSENLSNTLERFAKLASGLARKVPTLDRMTKARNARFSYDERRSSCSYGP
jgi:hypothetical protein